MSKFLAALALLVSFSAHAGDMDPRFTWDMAKREYKNGTLPAAADVVGEWMYVGQAEKKYSLYYPDGKYIAEGTLKQFFARIKALESFPPGTARYLLEYVGKDLDAGTEKAGDVFKPAANKTGLRYLSSSVAKHGDITDCEVQIECRMAQTPNSLVCASYVTADKGCVRVYGKDPYRYLMYVRP